MYMLEFTVMFMLQNVPWSTSNRDYQSNPKMWSIIYTPFGKRNDLCQNTFLCHVKI